MWLFKVILIKIRLNLKLSSLVVLATFQVLSTHTGLVATILEYTDKVVISIISESSIG